MKALVLAEHNRQEIAKGTYATIAAAQKMTDAVDVIVIGENCQSAAEQATKIAGVSTVHHADHAVFKDSLAETYTAVLEAVADAYDIFLAPASTFGKNIMPRLAAKLDIQMISEISAVIDEDTYERPIYAGNAIATVKTAQAKRVFTVRATSFDPVAADGGSAQLVTVSSVPEQDKARFVKMEASGGDRPELTSADIVVSGGRGVGSGEDFAIIEALADKLGAAVGASRAAVDAGYVPNDYQVGQTGKVVAPDLYIAIGISGAIQHLAGMKDSKVIVAINNDEDAPIFQVADYGLVADLFEAVPAFTKALS